MNKALKESGFFFFFDEGVGTGRIKVPREGLLQVVWNDLLILARVLFL